MGLSLQQRPKCCAFKININSLNRFATETHSKIAIPDCDYVAFERKWLRGLQDFSIIIYITICESIIISR